MSTRLAYWTSAYAPEMEAIGSQVAVLRKAFPGSITWGLNPNRLAQFSIHRGYIFNPRLWLPFRGATRILQNAFQVNHIVGGLGDWHYLRAAVKRPIVLTVATHSTACDRRLLNKVDKFIAEWHSDAAHLVSSGIERKRIHVIPPPVDLDRFSPSEAAGGPFRILFASSPDKAEWLADRGVDALLDAAKLRPQYQFHLLWRPWGDSYSTVLRWIEERNLKNVQVTLGALHNIEDTYRSAHVCVAPFRNAKTTKSVPNSLIESLACGRPVVTTPLVSLGMDIERDSSGRCVSPDGNSLATAFDDLEGRWESVSQNARRFAEAHFSAERYIESHRSLYALLSTPNRN